MKLNTRDIEIGIMQPEERGELLRVVGQALHFPLDYTQYWFDQIGEANLRVARHRGRVIAGLGIISMGQWFVGKRLPMAGVTAVGVALDYRGQGVGVALLRDMLHELYHSGISLSVLYPSSLPFYRSVGYERAGTRLTFEAPLHAFSSAERTLDAIPAADDTEVIRHVYARYAQKTSGSLDRAPFIWRRALQPRGEHTQAFVIQGSREAEGYVVLTQGQRSDPLQISDLCLLTKAAGLRIQALLARQSTMVERVMWHGAPGDPFAYLLAEQRATTTRTLDWMLRIIDVRAALAERGYPPNVSAELHLDVDDPVLPWNHGRWVLRVVNGYAEVQPGGDGLLRLGIRDLAALFTGHLSPAALQLVGSFEGSESDAWTAHLLFSNEHPRLAEIF